jgi:hypothetical protein
MVSSEQAPCDSVRRMAAGTKEPCETTACFRRQAVSSWWFGRAGSDHPEPKNPGGIAGWNLPSDSAQCSSLGQQAGTKKSCAKIAGCHHWAVWSSSFGRAGSGRSELTFPSVAAGLDRTVA